MILVVLDFLQSDVGVVEVDGVHSNGVGEFLASHGWDIPHIDMFPEGGDMLRTVVVRSRDFHGDGQGRQDGEGVRRVPVLSLPLDASLSFAAYFPLGEKLFPIPN